MDKETAKRILNIFRDPEERPKLRHFMPVEFEGTEYIVATDSHHFVMIPINEEINFPEPTEPVVNFKDILKPLTEPIEVDIKNLVDKFNSIENITRKVKNECPSCDGEGNFDHYGETYECKCCDGEGEYETSALETVKNPKARIVFKDCRFKPDIFNDLITTMAISCCSKLTIRQLGHMSVFELDDSILVGMMICMHDVDGKDDLIEIM